MTIKDDSSIRIIICSGIEQFKRMLKLRSVTCKLYSSQKTIGKVYGVINSAVVPTRDLSGKEFLFKDLKGSITRCYYSEIVTFYALNN